MPTPPLRHYSVYFADGTTTDVTANDDIAAFFLAQRAKPRVNIVRVKCVGVRPKLAKVKR